jgi:hypothetical protein
VCIRVPFPPLRGISVTFPPTPGTRQYREKMGVEILGFSSFYVRLNTVIRSVRNSLENTEFLNSSYKTYLNLTIKFNYIPHISLLGSFVTLTTMTYLTLNRFDILFKFSSTVPHILLFIYRSCLH